MKVVQYMPGTARDDRICGEIARFAILDNNFLDGLPGLKPLFGALDSIPLDSHNRLLALMSGEAIGFLDLDRKLKHICYLFVHPRYQRIGVGTGLVRVATTISSVTVQVLSANRTAVDWYRSHGFSITSAERNVDWHGVTTDWLQLTHVSKGEHSG